MTYTLTIEGSGNAHDESGSHTLCFKHSIIIAPSSSFLNLPDSQLDLSGSYVILYCRMHPTLQVLSLLFYAAKYGPQNEAYDG